MNVLPRVKLREKHSFSGAFVALSLLIIATFFLGGSPRGDEVTLLLLRPVSVIALLVSLYLVKAEHLLSNTFVSIWIFAVFILVLLHLVPLPPAVWHQLPGRELLVQVDATLGTDNAWRPFSLAPELTRNALWSLIAPLACYLLAIQLSQKELFKAFCLIFAMGLLSGLLSTIQISQGSESIFYIYKITNFGLGVGLFANRNHQALLLACLLPVSFGLMLIAARMQFMASLRHGPLIAVWATFVSSAFLAMLVLVTGSRSGLGLSCLGVAFIFLFVRRHRQKLKAIFGARAGQSQNAKPMNQRNLVLIALPTALFVATIAAMLAGQDAAFQRLAGTALEAEGRASIFNAIQVVIANYFPLGSGIGSFDPVYRIYEQDSLLRPTYWNHAHNDWAEAIMTGGLPAIILMVVGVVWIAKNFFIHEDKNNGTFDLVIFQFIALSVVGLTLVSSFVEYPLRVPIMSCIFALSLAILSKTRPRNRNTN